MKTVIKILILLILSVGSVAAVILLAQHIQPSVPIPSTDISYDTFNDEKIAKYKSQRAGKRLFKELEIILNHDSIMFSEDLIDNDKHLGNNRKIFDTFAPNFKNWCFEIFNASEWPAEDLDKMREYRTMLSGITNLSDSAKSCVNAVANVLDRYDDARKWCNVGHYSSNAKAKSDFATINGFINDNVLKNNTSLVASLRNSKSNIARSHYNLVKRNLEEREQKCNKSVRNGRPFQNGLVFELYDGREWTVREHGVHMNQLLGNFEEIITTYKNETGTSYSSQLYDFNQRWKRLWEKVQN